MVRRVSAFCFLFLILIYSTAFPGFSYQKFKFIVDQRVSLKPIKKEFHRSSILSFTTESFTDWTGLTKVQLDQKVRESAVGFSSIKHCVFSSPFFIFQATYGEKASDFYLFSLNTKTGDLIKVHKGYHRRFWVERERLIFQHTDHFFACPIDGWSRLTEIQDPVVNLDISKIHFSLESELPRELRAIDWENIHCVFQGSFKNKGQKELLFISGRIPSYKIALLCWEDSQMKLIDHQEVGRGKEFGELLSDEESNDSDNDMVNFRQAIFEDIDGDQRLEILINGVYSAWSYDADPLIYVDFSQPKSKKKFHLNKIQALTDAEIIRYNGKVLYVGKWHDSGYNIRRDVAYTLTYSAASGLVSLMEILPIPLETEEYIHQKVNIRFTNKNDLGPQPKHLSFASTARNLSDAGKPVFLKSKKLPKLTICPLYNALNPQLTAVEKLYHTKRNELLGQYVKKLDTGWNPIPGFSVKDFYIEEVTLDEKTAYQKWKDIEDMIPIFGKNELFAVVVVKIQETVKDYQYHMTFLFLYDSKLNLLDYQACTEWDPMHDPVEFYLPLPNENRICSNYGVMRGSIFNSYSIENRKFKEVLEIYHQGIDFVTYNNQLLLHVFINDNFLTTDLGGGRGNQVYYDYFIDPSNKQIKDLLFPDFFQNKLDYLYQMYHFYSYQKEPTESFEDPQIATTDHLERYEKNIFYHELKIKNLDDLQ